ncbi:MAG TPA: hypothetical protein VNQ90_04775 [Chthoniobacteraceae bacterium]|nr:hypothetical protein [Chthoniobacteraceae bacterium]
MTPSAAQYEVLQPYITDRVRELVRGRLLEGVKFFDKRALRSEYTRSEVKLVLLLVKIANPTEALTSEEQRLLE